MEAWRGSGGIASCRVRDDAPPRKNTSEPPDPKMISPVATYDDSETSVCFKGGAWTSATT